MEDLQPTASSSHSTATTTSTASSSRVTEMLRRLQESLMSEIEAHAHDHDDSSGSDMGMLAETLMLDASEEDFQASQTPFSSLTNGNAATTTSSTISSSTTTAFTKTADSILEAIQRNLRIHKKSQTGIIHGASKEDSTEFMPNGEPLDSSFSNSCTSSQDESDSETDSDDSMHIKDLQEELDEAEIKHGLEGSSRVKPMSQRTVSFNPFVSLLPVPPSFECSSSSSDDGEDNEQQEQQQEQEPMFVYQEMDLGHDDNFVGDIDETTAYLKNNNLNKSPQQSMDESHTSRTASVSLSSSEEEEEEGEENDSTISHRRRDVESLSTEESPCSGADQDNDDPIKMSTAAALSMAFLHKMTNCNATRITTSKHSAASVSPEPITSTHKHPTPPRKVVSNATTKRMATRASQQVAYAASLGADMTRLVAIKQRKSKAKTIRTTTGILCCLLLMAAVLVITLIATTTTLFQQQSTTKRSICGNGASQQQKQELVRMGDVELIFQNMPTNITNIGIDQLQQLFLDSYNAASGQCQGIFQRTLLNATITDSIIHSNLPARNLAHTQWETMVQCNGCPQDEPLFTIYDNNNNDINHNNQRKLLRLLEHNQTTSIIDYQYNTTQEFLATFARLINDGLPQIFVSEEPMVRLVYIGVRSITTGDIVHPYEVPSAPTIAPSHAPSSAPSTAPTMSSIPSSFPTTDIPSSFPTESPTRYPVYIDRFAITQGRWTIVEGYEDMQDGVEIDLADLPTNWRLTAIPNTEVGIVRFWIDGERAGADHVIHYVANHFRFPEIFENPNTGIYHLLEAQPDAVGKGLEKRSSLNFTVIDSRLLPDPPTTAPTAAPREPQVVTDQYFSCCQEEEIPEGVGLGQFVQIDGGFCQVCELNGETEPPGIGRMLR